MDEINQIQKRNKRVELDKAWEISWTRRGLIALATYAIAVLFMWKIHIIEPYLSALVPTGGYLLSTLSLSVIKKWWVRHHTK